MPVRASNDDRGKLPADNDEPSESRIRDRLISALWSNQYMSTLDPVEIGQSSYSAFEPVHQRPQQSNNTTATQPTAFPYIVLPDNQLTGQNVPQYRYALQISKDQLTNMQDQ
jgi:hypothetical protein